MSDVKEDIINILSNKYNLSKIEIKEIVDSQFSFVRDTMKDGKFNSVRLPYFGIFKPILRGRNGINRFLKQEE